MPVALQLGVNKQSIVRVILLMASIGGACGCESTYLVKRSDLEREAQLSARERAAVIPAQRENGTNVLLRSDRLLDRAEESDTDSPLLIRVRPQNRILTAAKVLAGLGGGVIAIGGIATVATATQPCDRDLCGLPPLLIGSTLGALSGVTLLTSAILAIVGRHAPEAGRRFVAHHPPKSL